MPPAVLVTADNAGPVRAEVAATWLDRLLYFEAPLWAFAVAYATFAALVAWTYWKYPPRH